MKNYQNQDKKHPHQASHEKKTTEQTNKNTGQKEIKKDIPTKMTTPKDRHF